VWEGSDTNRDEEHHPSPATVKQFLAKRERQYFKEGENLRRRNYRNAVCLVHHLILNRVHPEVWLMPKGGPTALVLISVIEVSDGKILEDDNDDDKSPAKTSTSSDYRRS
jgi:hypothetical protein